MIDKILNVTQSYDVLYPSERTWIPWQNVLVYAVGKGAQALIDTGALLAGVANHDAASFLFGQANFSFEGVTYYDSRMENNCWMVTEKARRTVMPLKNAPMLEKETFVIFDEARSRGSDMKLLPDAAAVLTLGPKLTKDKLMQGAGRMRQLGCDQTLWIASFDEIAQSILQASDCNCLSKLSAIDVLKWVLDNTQAEAVRGLVEWARNGIHFRETQLDKGAELISENWLLATLYQEALSVDKIARVIEAMACRGFKGSNDELVTAICRSGHKPAEEKIWTYTNIMRAQSVDDLCGIVEVVDMRSYIHQWVSPKELTNLDWSSARIFGTENFFSTITGREKLDSMTEFLRVIDVMLVFHNGHVLLVSEFEADHILELLWSSRKSSTACNFRFLNLSFACEGIDRVGAQTKFRCVRQALGSRLDQSLALLSTVACHLYNGETMLAKHQLATVETETRKLLGPLGQRESNLRNFVTSRGNTHKWTRSFLHELCYRMDLEDCEA
ncbi:hypothetical protein BBO99_00006104 [Phytophthora kernoviae]|uniref:ubiquitinyl hydrolase 1 n=1 Tax=Phytophthora kernoviae TaxID=325452 RepID=A0A3R7JY51_9STRA|nr:hypothetical protein JM16_005824 [Phytophthora kernoviae]KAG2522901.1 hypothetical protein JM18_005943 [Phytophthora kernoviae]RLN05957.1 hypothetical protein BBI17_006186 [Phytophthora kernoviae]RLN78245.1 hypothetical protein BBO99_00006104 [Phytophthora kernoviae]